MRTKAIGTLSGLFLLLTAALFTLALIVRSEQYRNLLLVTPVGIGSPAFSPEKVEQFCEDEFLITYEILQAKTVKVLHSDHQVTLVGTNSSYRNLMEYTILNGSFFTKTAWDAEQKHAVLNEAAAYDIFGSVSISGQTLKISGETWLVVGVIQDGDDESSKIYVPSSVTGGIADSLLGLLNPDDGITEAYAKNALKELGVNEVSLYIINLSDFVLTYQERFSIAWETAICILILIIIRHKAIKLRNKLLNFRERLKWKYLKELFAESRMDFMQTAGSVFLMFAGAGGILSIVPRILSTCLKWQDLPPISVLISEGSFKARTAFLHDHDLLGTVLFSISLIALTLILILTWKRLPHDMEGSKETHIEERSNG